MLHTCVFHCSRTSNKYTQFQRRYKLVLIDTADAEIVIFFFACFVVVAFLYIFGCCSMFNASYCVRSVDLQFYFVVCGILMAYNLYFVFCLLCTVYLRCIQYTVKTVMAIRRLYQSKMMLCVYCVRVFRVVAFIFIFTRGYCGSYCYSENSFVCRSV